jgi:hypothetical protein
MNFVVSHSWMIVELKVSIDFISLDFIVDDKNLENQIMFGKEMLF